MSTEHCTALEAVMTATFGDIEARYAHWRDFLFRLEADDGPIAPRLEAYRREHGLPLDLWGGPSFRQEGFEFPAFVWQRPASFPDADLAAYVEGSAPCAPTVTIFAKQIPARGSEEVYAADEVHEIDRSGATLRSWRVPRDSLVEDLSGEELRIGYRLIPLCRPPAAISHPQARVELAVRPDGAFRVVAPRRDAAPGTPYECSHVGAFPGSAYLRCQAFVDLRSKEVRRIAFEGSCT